MPTAIRGKVYWYDFGPIVGSELSSERPALIISNSALNRTTSVAIAVPLSSTQPPARHLRNHVFIEEASSWASVRQLKTVSQAELGDELATATPGEMASTLEILVARLNSGQSPGGTLETGYGEEAISPGAVWEVEFQRDDGLAEYRRLLVLDHNAGNHMAITAELEFRERQESGISMPISLMETSGPACVRIHRISSVDISERAVRRTGTVTGDDLHMVYAKLFRLLAAE